MKFIFIVKFILIIVIIGGVVIIIFPHTPEPPCWACGEGVLRILGIINVLAGIVGLIATNKLTENSQLK